jgi:hypothetical protein
MMGEETITTTTEVETTKPKRKPTRNYDVIDDGRTRCRTCAKLGHTLRLGCIDTDPHGTGPAISLLDADLVYSGGKTRVAGLVCTKCGAGRVPLTDDPAIIKSAANLPHSPASYTCELCGHHFSRLGGLIGAFGGTWEEQLALLRKVGGSTPIEREWVIAEHDAKPSMREARIGRLARPLEQWNVRPTIAERHELSEAQRAHRLEVEAAIDQELRMLRSQRLAEAGI